MINNKRGMVQELLALVIVGFIAALFFAGWYYGSNVVNNVLTSGNLDTSLNVVTSSIGDNGQITQNSSTFVVNVSNVASNTYSQVNSGENLLGFVAAMIFLAFVIGTLMICYFSPSHPLLIGVEFLVTIIVGVFSVYISKSYTALYANSAIGSTLQSWGLISWLMSSLPIWVIGTGLLGCAISLYRYFSGGSQPY